LVWLLVTGRTSVANAAAGAFAMQLLASRLQQIAGATSTLVEGGLFLEDYRQFLGVSDATEASPTSGAPPARPGHFEGLRMDGVSFTYPLTGRQVLEDVSLELRPGEVVALVGENGSGKTTLVKLLCRLYTQVDRGRILLNGHDVRDLDPREMREQVTVLFQDFVRYELSVADNIVMGRPDAPSSEARISEAARRAGAERLIEQLPSGYATRLGRRFHGGAELSGGQWQRLALARAFYRGGDVLILDEPTAALDPRAEAEFFRQVGELAADKSVILVSHRFSSVRTADRIYVLQEGRVIESGPHDDLVRLNGVYAELYGIQVRAYFGDDPRQN
jgi:ATP-binding cassette subfamily B protein